MAIETCSPRFFRSPDRVDCVALPDPDAVPLERDMSMTLNRMFQSDYNTSYSEQIAASAACHVQQKYFFTELA